METFTTPKKYRLEFSKGGAFGTVSVYNPDGSKIFATQGLMISASTDPRLKFDSFVLQSIDTRMVAYVILPDMATVVPFDVTSRQSYIELIGCFY